MPAKKESVSFFFPAYFDGESIPGLVKEAYAILLKSGRDFEIIVVDDCSPDNTGKIADGLAKEMKNVRVVHNKRNLGYGGALTEGFLSAKKELVGFTDGDGQFSLGNLPKFLDAIEGNDVVVGYRKNRSEGFTRKLFHDCYKLSLLLVLGMDFRDPDCGFKLLRRRHFEKIRPVSGSGFFSAEMLFRAKLAGLRIKEIPVKHLPRRYGQSKCFKPGEIFAMGRDVLAMRFGKSK